MWHFLLTLFLFCFVSSSLFPFPIYEGFYPAKWKDLTKESLIDVEKDSYEWQGLPFIWFQQEYKEKKHKEINFLFFYYTNSFYYIKWEFPLTTRTLFFPFSLFSYLESKKDDRLVIFTPIFYRKKYTENSIQNDFIFYWLGFLDKEGSSYTYCYIWLWCLQSNSNYTSNWLFPLYYYSKDLQTQEKTFFTIFHPFLALIYAGPMPWSTRFKEKDEYWRNWFTVLHFRYKKDKDQDHKLYSFVFFPLIWYKKENYFWFIPFYYNQRNNNTLTWHNIFLIYYQSFEYNEFQEKYTSSLFLFPFFYIQFLPEKSENELEFQKTYTSFFMFPIIPFVLYEKNKEEKKSLFWFLLYYYEKNYDSSSSETNLFFPLWFYKNYEQGNPEIQHYMLISPIFFKYLNSQNNTNYFWSLLYYTWQTSESKGSIFLPFRVNYQDKRKEFDLWLTYSFSSDKVSYKNNALYIDIDHALFYNLFRISIRKKIPLSIDEYKKVLQKENNEEESLFNPIETSDPFDREASDTYLSWLFLFGWIKYIDSYQYKEIQNIPGDLQNTIEKNHKLEHWKHFRILPFTWLSWKVNSNQQVQFYFACCLWYEGEENEKTIKYIAFFPLFIPLYGYYQKDKDYTKFLFMNFYIESYEDEDQLKEIFIFWPFSKFYSSSKEQGSYLFPIYSYKKFRSEQEEIARNFSLLHYYKREKIQNHKFIYEESNIMIFPLLFYYSFVLEKSKSLEKKESFWTIFPFYYINKSTTNELEFSEWKIFYIFGSEETFQKGKLEESTKNWIPLYYKSIYNHTIFTFVFFSLYISSETENENWYNWFLLFYLQRNKIYSAPKQPFTNNTKDIKENNKDSLSFISYLHFFPFLFVNRNYASKTNMDNKENTFHTYTESVHFLLFGWYNDFNLKTKEIELDYFLFFPIFRFDNQRCESFSFNLIRYCKNENYFRIFPVIWYKEKDYFTIFPLFTLDYKENQLNGLILYPILSQYNNNNDFVLFLYILGHRNYLDQNNYCYNITLLFWNCKKNAGTTNLLFPLYFYYTKQKLNNEKENYQFLLMFPTLGWREKEWEDISHCQLLCLLYYGKENEHKNNNYFLMSTLAIFENKKDNSKEIWLLWRLLFWYEKNSNNDSFKFLILGTGYEEEKGISRIRILGF